MLIPSIDLMGGETVQLVGGREHALSAGDPRPLAVRFGRVGEVAVIDLDAALGQGSNQQLIEQTLPLAACRVGGGIRSLEAATQWLNAGAAKIIIGTAAKPELLQQLPPARTIAALDALHGEVVVKGWREGTGQKVAERLAVLRELVSGFLITFVEREGRMQGIDLPAIKELVAAAGKARVTIAGGVTTPEDIRALDEIGADAQVGMALYTGKLDLAAAFCAPLTSDRPDGLWPTLVTDEAGRALGLVYSNLASVQAALASGRGVYWSRRHGLWEKGKSSGATQKLVRLDLDCDRDCVLAVVEQAPPGFCHRETASCFGNLPFSLQGLQQDLLARIQSAGEKSYTAKLAADPVLLQAKLREEAAELAAAHTQPEIVHEAADLLYFTLTKLAATGVPLAQVEAELARRHQQLSHRHGEAKPAMTNQESN